MTLNVQIDKLVGVAASRSLFTIMAKVKFPTVYRQAKANVDYDKNMLLLKNPQF